MAGVSTTVLEGIRYLVANSDQALGLLVQHLKLVLVSELAAIAIAVPLGVLAVRYERAREPIMAAGNVAQTIPSLAVIALMFPILGLGFRPAVVALFVYALLPILTNTIAGIDGIEQSTLDAARGMGMTDNELLVRIQLPIAFPVIFAGIRTSTVINVGTAYLAFFIGAGGLGRWVISGIDLFDMSQVFAGALVGAVLAITLDLALAGIERQLRSDSGGQTAAV
ncbi:ABC transporter permease [Natrinema versiforme]|uniref:Binding-protein-dependent transport systems inner membrane component n=1 Tax=Natrinema versiforme JCM 10478 TaxID=1227496 RepID=L9XNZ6_9EURY|nr:ABC transporter permease [Natrinema versiforme]ELY63282.1 binding-protein-dependent transport systems inner membrane component [Natrinema versiforme JCM 10478]